MKYLLKKEFSRCCIQYVLFQLIISWYSLLLGNIIMALFAYISLQI